MQQKNALQKAVSESGLKMQMDADLNKLGLQLAVDMASGEGYDFEVGLPMRERRLQKSTNYYKSWMYESAGFLTSSNGIAYVQEQITNSLTYLAERYTDYNLVGIIIIENANQNRDNKIRCRCELYRQLFFLLCFQGESIPLPRKQRMAAARAHLSKLR